MRTFANSREPWRIHTYLRMHLARRALRTRGRVILPRPKAPPGHAHGARRATFWPGPPAARTLKWQTARREPRHKIGRAGGCRRASAGHGSCAGHFHLKRPYIPSGGPSSRPCHHGCNDTFPNPQSENRCHHSHLSPDGGVVVVGWRCKKKGSEKFFLASGESIR